MDKTEIQALVDGAKAYDSLFVPALFGQWSQIVADASGAAVGHTALDVACGTGVLSKELSQRVTDSGHVTGIDPNIGMLTVARESDSSINWEQGIAESLPFESGTFDCVASQFGLMFFQNPAAAVQEILRVLKPSGAVAIAVWDSIKNIPGYRAEHALIEKLAGSAAAKAVEAPFQMGDKNELRDLFLEAGAKTVSIETHLGVARFPNIATMVGAELRGWLPIMGVNLEEALIEEILIKAEEELSEFRCADKVEFEIAAHVAVLSN